MCVLESRCFARSDSVIDRATQGHILCEGFCTACFSGEYSAGMSKDTRKSRFEQKI